MPRAPKDAPKILATQREDTPRNMVVETPEDVPNVRIIVMPALLRMVVRGSRVYLQSLIGLLLLTTTPIAGTLPEPMVPADALTKIVTAAGMALFPAFVSLLWNGLELLNKVDEKLPEWRG